MRLPNPLPPDRMRPLERRSELCRLLGLGLVRLRLRDHGAGAQSSTLSGPGGESSLDCPARRSGHAIHATEETA